VFKVTLTNFGSEWEFPTFDEAVKKAKSTGFECSIWDTETQTNFGSELVAVCSPLRGFQNLRRK
jgi:hypothetical protein